MEHSTATAACDPAGEARDSAVSAGQVAYVDDGPAAGAAWVGVLYESSEWSDFKLAQELASLDVPVRMIDMERVDAVEAALACRLLASRVFASALARGHAASHARMAEVIDRAGERGVVLINRGRAHAYEVSKRLATETLGREGIAVPAVYACAVPGAINPVTLPYPCIIKPDCGGRSARTAMLRDAGEAQAFLAAAPSTTVFIVESFEWARAGYLTRIEIVGGRVAHAHRRSVAANGLSSYHFGSTFEPYTDCPDSVCTAAEQAAALLGFELGSFDVIETETAPVFIDANSVSNVSADCEELLGYDLMAEHAAYIAGRYRTLFG